MNIDTILSKHQAWINSTFEKLDRKLSKTSVKSREKLPYTTVDGVHDNKTEDNVFWWTNGFWGGLMWLMYAETNKDCYLQTAKRSEQLMDSALACVEKLDHDVGFQWHILSGASYRLTGDMASKERCLHAANILKGRFRTDKEFLVAWNGEEAAHWSIIDTMMNLPLLYWAAKETGDASFAEIACKHADMAMRDHVRPDGSVAHIVSHEHDEIQTFGGQGFAEGSSWSRGASWAIYGFTLSYLHSGDVRYLDTAKKTAHYFALNAEQSDWLPLIDFRAPATPVKYDSTAGAIAACAMIELAKIVPGHEKALYLRSAIRLLERMESVWCNWNDDEDGILMQGSERYGRGENQNIIYGDYFFAEALLKLKGSEFLPW